MTAPVNISRPAHENSYPAKILLLGEYGILLGSAALAIPYPVYKGSFTTPANNPGIAETDASHESNAHLRSLSDFLHSEPETYHFLDHKKLNQDIESGLWFSSNIPQGYGAGSSGALTAAIFDHYGSPAEKERSLPEIRQLLASVEKYFHGTSSGLDPLVSWLKKPVLIDEYGKAQPPEFVLTKSNIAHSIFLIDTKTTGKTGNLVQWFMNEYDSWEFRRAVNEVFIPATNQAVSMLLQNRYPLFEESFGAISSFQMQFLNNLIPESIIPHFEQGLISGEFYLKLCGSGGGGFMLGVTHNQALTRTYFETHGFDIRFLSEADIPT